MTASPCWCLRCAQCFSHLHQQFAFVCLQFTNAEGVHRSADMGLSASWSLSPLLAVTNGVLCAQKAST